MRTLLLMAAWLCCSLPLRAEESPAPPAAIEAVVLNLIASAEVPADEAGALVEVAVQPGARVKRGDLVARIDDRDALLALERAKLAAEHAAEQAANDVKLRTTKKTLEVAKLELKRAEDANRDLADVVSKTQMEKLRVDVEKAELEVEQATKDMAAAQRLAKAARHDVQVAARAVERRRIVAPIEGVVAEVRRQDGEWLEPGETIVRIVRDDKLRAEGFIDVSRLSLLAESDPVELEVPLPQFKAQRFPGKIVFIAPEANPINGQIRVWAEIDNPERKLRAGMPAQVRWLPPSSNPKAAP